MRKSTLTLVASLLFFNLLLAHNGDPKPASSTTKISPEVTTGLGVSLKDIFISDYEGVTLFVDFQAVKDEVESLNLLKGDLVILKDDVHALPSNTIYELDLEKLQAGKYRVELITVQGISIQKDLVVQ
ncbi:MAG: hypothetical protein ACI8YQ_000643 [Polaribacter sp.]|jgi:hypothetical protein